jgi:hypothetical protein
MKVALLLTLLVSGNLFAGQSEIDKKDCRSAIVEAQNVLGNRVSPTSFSSRSFDSYNLTTAEFNDLDSRAQAEIYQQVKPLSVMLEETVSDLSRRIRSYSESFYAFFMVDEIAQMQEVRDGLRQCSMEEEE